MCERLILKIIILLWVANLQFQLVSGYPPEPKSIRLGQYEKCEPVGGWCDYGKWLWCHEYRNSSKSNSSSNPYNNNNHYNNNNYYSSSNNNNQNQKYNVNLNYQSQSQSQNQNQNQQYQHRGLALAQVQDSNPDEGRYGMCDCLHRSRQVFDSQRNRCVGLPGTECNVYIGERDCIFNSYCSFKKETGRSSCTCKSGFARDGETCRDLTSPDLNSLRIEEHQKQLIALNYIALQSQYQNKHRQNQLFK